MELITNIIIEYLKHNKRLCVPKLGTFIVKQSSGTIVFSDLMRNDDGVLRSLLLAYGVKELEANGMIDRFVFEIRHAITTEGKITIEHLGEFSANINNTITFSQPQRQQKFGGNIKPPVEVLEQQKKRHGYRPTPTPTAQQEVKRQTKTRRAATSESDNITLGKPDAYLRGLKYDNDKNKKREESSSSSRRARSSQWVIVLLCLIIVGGAAALFWFEKQPSTPATPPSMKAAPVDNHHEATPIIMSDTTLLTEPLTDSLMVAIPYISPSNAINEN